ncbi:T6SS immunity protein Tli4 family protein [Paraburkholderia flagellata]|uniref:T6SS immunity protein Tli4 family protein n=1 Tax=Paraburkholderia flagellata TaxID=2883241 RepID=UPI001EECDE76|nr:T6SS immunity protein Tli4 family protein [Paraburkholderia flagellata]
MTELTANLKTRCVGRYLVDMPEGATEYGYARIGGVDIEAKAMTEDAYRQEIAQRETVLKTVEITYPRPFLYAAGPARGRSTYYFIYRDTLIDSPATRYIEGYKWDRGYRFLLKIETYDYVHPDQTDDPIVKQFDVKNEVPAKTNLVFDLLEKLRGRPNEEIPTEPGVCFAGGFLPGKATDDQYVRGGFTLTSNPDVSFVVSVDTASQGGITLLQHADDSQTLDALKAMDAKVIRKGTVELSGLRAEEWLFEGLKPGDGRGDTFTLSVNDTTSGPSSPYLSLEMDTGGQLKIQGKFVKLDKGSLTTREAIALWDAVSRKVRVRPGAFGYRFSNNISNR